MYRTLDPDKIVDTLVTLERRIVERFPAASLARVAAELTAIAREAHARSAALERPRYGLRLISGIVILAGIAGLAALATAATRMRDLQASTELFGMMQGIDAGLNMLIVVGGALFFLVTLETRLKRRTALAHLHELRSIVHVVDMHQLTKDPSILIGQAHDTPHSPKRTMSPFELTRYLDYCSELLSLSAKIAALYAQSSTDAQVIDVVNDIERLTTNLSSKVWQKITLVEASSRSMVASAPLAAPQSAPSVLAVSPRTP